MDPDQSRPLLISIVGPTAVGKTALGITLCESLGGEVVSADSRQFYRWMDIGTAKPDAAELARARHHLIDIATPDETVGLAQFLQLARGAIEDILHRRKLPLLIGGTGQYVQALLQGWQVPEVAPDLRLRAELEARALTDPNGVWQQLLSLDPDASTLIDPRNVRRVVRALEVTLKTGQPFSAQRRRIPPPYRLLQIGLTLERQTLYSRADARVDRMIADGLEDEVRHLLSMGYGWDLPAMSGLGYVQFKPYLEGHAAPVDVVARIKLDTHDFIRRQYAWFRLTDPDIHWLDVSREPSEAAMALVATELS